MKPKYAIFVMFFVMLFALGMVAQSAAPAAPADDKAGCACCSHDGAKADAKTCGKDCCKDGKCDMKDGKMACGKDCCKDMAKGESCCKDGKCEMAKGGKHKGCCGDHCKMHKDA